MIENEKRDIKIPQSIQQDKDTKHCRIKQTVAALFMSGEQLTAAHVNQYSGTNDARKYISLLRKQGMKIVDYRLPGNRKVYFVKNNAL